MLHVARTKAIKKWGFNTSENFMNLRADDFFVERCGNNIHTMRRKYYQKNIYMTMCTVCLKGDANSYSRKYGGKSERRHVCNRKLPTHRIRTWPLVGNSQL